MSITPNGGRVLGCLVEKQLTTPQQYPLTLNALALACSQSTNRAPVMELEEADVLEALGELKERHLVRFVLPSHGKSVTRYRHVLDEALGLDTARAALLAVLLLRGPQTTGELRARTGRMAEFESLEALQGELRILADRDEPLVRLLPRRPGQKEERWQQLVAAESGGSGDAGTAASPATARRPPETDGADRGDRADSADAADGADSRTGLDRRVAELESEVTAVRAELLAVAASLTDLRRRLGE